MIVVADTSPICYLVLIGEADLSRRLFGRVIVPPAVSAELTARGAPEEVRLWAAEAPDWLEVRSPKRAFAVGTSELHGGEREVLALAKEMDADLVIVDDGAARRASSDLDLPYTGLLGVLDRAAKRDLIDLKQALGRLRETNFRIAPRLLSALLRSHDNSVDPE